MFTYRSPARFWNYYKSVVERLMTDTTSATDKSLAYWQNQLFLKAITYALPVSLLVLIPCVIIELRAGQTYKAISDICTLTFVMFIALNNRITLTHRKILITITITLLSIVMITFLGTVVMGFIYLFSLSIFIALQFSDKFAYGAVAINFLIFTLITLLLYFAPLHIPLLSQNTDLNSWLIYSANFLLMNLIMVGIIRQLLNGLDETMLKVVFLYHELHKEMAENESRDVRLKESEIQHTKAIEVRNQQLKQIAYLQSHIVRRPLANIKGISGLLMQNNSVEVEKQLLTYLDQSVTQLDTVIDEIIKQSEA